MIKLTRFKFCHFATLCLHTLLADGKKKVVREVVMARTGKALVLPRDPASKAEPDLHPADEHGFGSQSWNLDVMLGCGFDR